ncbi:hypothetical protein ACJMK2_001599, partial [Sinanodonta woodiana]
MLKNRLDQTLCSPFKGVTNLLNHKVSHQALCCTDSKEKVSCVDSKFPTPVKPDRLQHWLT